jgi:hypothetical protein
LIDFVSIILKGLLENYDTLKVLNDTKKNDCQLIEESGKLEREFYD